MSSTLTYTGRLTVETCWCGIAHAIPETLSIEAHRIGTAVYCPLGHSWVVKESETDRLKRSLAFERDLRASIAAERDQAAASLRATRGVVTKLRKRAVAGACPFGCHRHFADLQRHVASKHPGLALEGEA